MRSWAAGACAVALLGGCGGSKPEALPTPVPGPEPAPTVPAPSGPLTYRVRGPLTYELERYDSLFYATMPGAPQITAKRAVLTVRPLPGRSGEIEVVLDSISALEDTRLTSGGIDSSLGSRWQLTLGAGGPRGSLLGGKPTVISGQIGAAVRLLFPQLPQSGLRRQDVWTDSAAYRVQLDAFDAFESAARSSQAVPGSGVPGLAAGGIMVEGTERLVRTGTAMQAGQTMTLKGTGLRRLRYGFGPDGWVSMMTARDSLDLVVTVGPGGDAVAVRWRSTLIGRLRDLPIR